MKITQLCKLTILKQKKLSCNKFIGRGRRWGRGFPSHHNFTIERKAHKTREPRGRTAPSNWEWSIPEGFPEEVALTELSFTG